MKLIAYLREHLTLPDENFVREWGKLTEQDKTDLKDYAREECKARGIALED